MGRTRRRLPTELKARVALVAVRGEKTINEIASEFGVHPNQVRKWKKELEEGAKDLFSDRRGKRDREEDDLVGRLYQEIGQLKVELDWLKKKVGYGD